MRLLTDYVLLDFYNKTTNDLLGICLYFLILVQRLLMCGFIGIYNRNSKVGFDSENIVNGLKEINHRGPDEHNIWIDSNHKAALGHARLSIIGLDDGAQPITAQNGTLHIVVNGEFYGFESIRKELIEKGYPFKTQSDSEIALHLYQDSGVAGLERLRGEFSLIIYDAEKEVMLLMRDRMGIKPLYYAEHEGQFYVSSEIKAILAAGYPSIWDIDAYTTRAFYLQDRTLFQGVRSVKAGHFVSISRGGLSQSCYWDIEYATSTELDNDSRSSDTYISQLHDLVKESVGLRLKSDVPVAVYLSGGIDSSAMLGIANSISEKPLDSFNLSFTDIKGYDENAFARLA